MESRTITVSYAGTHITLGDVNMNELLEELKSEYHKTNIPDDAITARQLAEELGCGRRKANDMLYQKFLAGELERDRKTEGHASLYYYWKSSVASNDET